MKPRITQMPRMLDWGAHSLPAVCGRLGADWKAWPLLRIRCSSGVAETIMPLQTRTKKLLEFFPFDC